MIPTPPEGLARPEAQQHGHRVAAFVDAADLDLLASLRAALSDPFRDPVRVCGQLMPRRLARQIERPVGKLVTAARRVAA